MEQYGLRHLLHLYLWFPRHTTHSIAICYEDYRQIINSMLLRIFIVILIFVSTRSLSLRPTHNYWFLKESPGANQGSDSRWQYCDLKCLYLERYNPDKDFVVLVLSAPLRDAFSACYVKTMNGFLLWNKVVSNRYFEEYCGKDDKDWANMGLFKIVGVYGDGLGAQIAEDATYTAK